MHGFNFSLVQTFHSRKYDNIFATSVIEVRFNCKIAKFGSKFASVFCVDTRKYIGKNNTQVDGSMLTHDVIVNFMSYNSIII